MSVAAPAARITLITGPPGSGKTTVARELATRAACGVHLVGDEFFAFLAHPVPPTTREAHAQNGTVLRALARAAMSYAEGGYDVYVDGIVGPWFLDEFRAALGGGAVGLNYVVLRTGLAETIRRGTGRKDQPVTEEVVRAMFPKFHDLAALERHAIDASKRSPSELAEHIAELLDAGSLELTSR